MKRTEQLSTFYNSELAPVLKRLDGERQGLVFRIAAAFLLLVVAFAAIGYYVVKVVEVEMMAFFLVPLLLLSIMGFYMMLENIVKNTRYYADYKKEVIHRLISLINPSLHYDKKHHISHHEFHNSGFFPNAPVDIFGDDHVSGNVNGLNVEFSELAARYKKSSDRKAHNTDFQFRGIFFVAEREKPYPADMIIEPRKDDNGNDIVLPIRHEQFNEYFQVRLPNNDYRQEAIDFLTTDFLSELVLFRRHMHNPLLVSFKYNKLYVGILHDKDLLEPSVLTSVARFDHIQQHFNDLYVPINIIEHFAAGMVAEAIEDEVLEAN